MTLPLRLGAGWQRLAEQFDEELHALDPGASGSAALEDGFLRLRVVNASPRTKAAITALRRAYESRAATTCEMCGDAGGVRAGAVVLVLCEHCLDECSA